MFYSPLAPMFPLSELLLKKVHAFLSGMKRKKKNRLGTDMKWQQEENLIEQ